jgi:proline iminopeptidase
MKRLILFLLLSAMFGCNKEDPNAKGLLVPKTVDEDPSIPSLIINGTQLHVESYGLPTNPMVVMIHGGPGGDFRSLLSAKVLADEGFFVVFYDQRGAGLSKREDKSQFETKGVQLMIDDLDALIAHFKTAADQKVLLFGHSWGAMLASAYINQHPEQITGAILAEPGGLTWPQTTDYLSRSNKIKFFSEALNDALLPEQVFSGCSEHEILDYKSAYFGTFEYAPGNTIGDAGPYPHWRSGAIAASTMIAYAEKYGFDFTTDLHRFPTKILFMYSELNRAYGLDWAKKVSAVYPNVELSEVKGSGHEMLYFGWNALYPKALTYLNELK